MSKIKLTGENSGYVEISAGQNAGNNTLETPTSGTRLVAHEGSQDVTLNANLTVNGVLTYDDVTNIDSVGVITARNGLNVTGGSVGIGTDTTDRQLAVYHATQGTIEIKSSDNGQSSLWFSDISDGNVGGVYYEHSNNAMVFRANDVERLRITSGGSVGIGLTNPSAPLHLSGPAEIRLNNAIDAGNFARIRCFEVSGDNGAHLAFNTGAGEVVRFQNNGTIGINSTTPHRQLVVGGGSGDISCLGENGGIYFGTSTGGFRNNGAIARAQQAGYHVSTSQVGDLVMAPEADKALIFSSGGSSTMYERLRLTTDGKIGIGDQSPENTLSIKNIGSFEGDANSFYLGSNFTGTGQNFSGSGKHAQRFFFNNASSNGYLRYENTGTTGNAGDAITWQERFRIRADGTIRIGGDYYTNTAIQMSLKSSTSGCQIQMHDTGTGTGTSDGLRVGYNGAGGQMWLFESGYIRFATGNAERLRVDPNGRILVGPGATATPKCGYAGIDIPNNDWSIIMGGSDGSGNRANNANKDGRFAGAHYVNAEEPVGIIRCTSGASENILYMGGGTSLVNAATQISLYTAANTTTTGGTERLRITSAGQVIVNGTANLAHPNMDDIIVGDASGNRGITVASGSSGFGTLAFGDSTDGSGNDRYQGFVEYYHNDNSMRLGTVAQERLRITSSGSLLHKGNNSGTIDNTDGDSQASAGYPAGGATFNKNVSVNNGTSDFGQCMSMISHTKSVNLDGSTNHNMITFYNREGCSVGHIYVGYSTGGDGAVAMYKFSTFYSTNSITAELGPSSRSSDTVSVNISSSNDGHTIRVNGNGYNGNVTVGVVFLSVGRSDSDHYGVRYW